MFKRDVVNEGSSSSLVTRFFNQAGDPDVPTTVSVHIQCITTGTEIRIETAEAVASSIEIQIAATENRIINTNHSVEKRRVTVKATFGNNQAFNEQFDYVIKNLSQVN